MGPIRSCNSDYYAGNNAIEESVKSLPWKKKTICIVNKIVSGLKVQDRDTDLTYGLPKLPTYELEWKLGREGWRNGSLVESTL